MVDRNAAQGERPICGQRYHLPTAACSRRHEAARSRILVQVSSTEAPTQPAVRIARRCWVDPQVAADLPARCAAVVETSADFTVVASLTAARLHGMWLPELPGVIHLATAVPGAAGRQMTRTRRPEFVAHRFQLRPEDIVTIGGLQVTSPARTWRDLARVLDLPDLVAAGDSMLRAGTTVEEVADLLGSMPRAPRSGRARSALPLLDARSRSRPESHLRVAVSAPDLPRFEVNVAVSRDEGGWLAEPDLSLVEAKIALEYQGVDHADPVRMRKDLTRFVDLRHEHWLAFAYGPVEVFRRPWEIRGEVRASILDRAPHLVRSRSHRAGR